VKNRLKGLRSRSYKGQGHEGLFFAAAKLKDIFAKKMEYRLGMK